MTNRNLRDFPKSNKYMSIKKIGILLHSNCTYPRPGAAYPPANSYMIWALAEEWRMMGYQTEVIKGISRRCDVDVLIPHIDLTVMPADYQRFLSGFQMVLNNRARDISKRLFSKNLVGPESEYEGPVIVKTDANAGGRPELTHSFLGSRSRLTGMVLRRANELLPRRWKRSLRAEKYPVYKNVRSVPQDIFRNKRMIVERFTPEKEGDLYVLRYYMFMGNCHTNVKMVSNQPVFKGHGVVSRAHVPVHPDIVKLKQKMGFDYGKFDYVISQGQVILLDTNITPGPAPVAYRRELAQILAPGIKSYIEDIT